MHNDLVEVGLLDFIESKTAKLNPMLANGLAYSCGKLIEPFIDDTFKAVIKGFENNGSFIFRYIGCERATPLEEYNELTRQRDSKRTFDLSRSDTYMMRYNFEFNGNIYSKLISLPFISEGGTMFLKGTQHHISPVLADVAIEVTPPDIFVRILRDRLTFSRAPYNYISNCGAKISLGNNKYHYADQRETIPVVRSSIYNQTEEMRKRRKIYNLDTNLVFYLLCKYGATEMFHRFTQTDVRFLNFDDPLLRNYNEDDWVICRTIGKQPQTLNKGYYKPTPIVIILPRDSYTQINKALIAGMFYVLDHFNEEISIDDLDTTIRWRVCMGMKLWGHEPNAGKLLSDLSAHIDSLDNYIEVITHKKFLSIGLNIENVYELFFVIIEKFDEWQAAHINNESNLYGKELTVLYYLCSDITAQIVKFYFKMMKDSKKGLTTNDVLNNMNRLLKTGSILGVYKGHGEISVVNSSGDNMIYRLTQVLVPQSKTGKTKKTSRINLNAASMRLHVSVAEICTYSGMPKSSPDGHTRLNLHVNVDPETGKVLRSEELRPLLDRVQEELMEGRSTSIKKHK